MVSVQFQKALINHLCLLICETTYGKTGIFQFSKMKKKVKKFPDRICQLVAFESYEALELLRCSFCTRTVSSDQHRCWCWCKALQQSKFHLQERLSQERPPRPRSLHCSETHLPVVSFEAFGNTYKPFYSFFFFFLTL